jgi:hypothetical protein
MPHPITDERASPEANTFNLRRRPSRQELIHNFNALFENQNQAFIEKAPQFPFLAFQTLPQAVIKNIYQKECDALDQAINTLNNPDLRKKFEKVRELIKTKDPLNFFSFMTMIPALRNTTLVIKNNVEVNSYLAYAKTVQGSPRIGMKVTGLAMMAAGLALAVLSGLIFAKTLGLGSPAAFGLAGSSVTLFAGGAKCWHEGRASGPSKAMTEAATLHKRLSQGTP